jgi:hypothetical protein
MGSSLEEVDTHGLGATTCNELLLHKKVRLQLRKHEEFIKTTRRWRCSAASLDPSLRGAAFATRQPRKIFTIALPHNERKLDLSQAQAKLIQPTSCSLEKTPL